MGSFHWVGQDRQDIDGYESIRIIGGFLGTTRAFRAYDCFFRLRSVPGSWLHTTIFPPYFVAGAIFSGFAMVLTLMIPARKCLGLRNSSPSGTWTTCANHSGNRFDRWSCLRN